MKKLVTTNATGILRAIALMLLLTAGKSLAQTAPRYLILFQDKNGTPFSTDAPEAFLSERSIQRRVKQQIPILERDLPVNPAYVEAVKNTGAYVWYSTRWFNGVVVSATESELQAIQELPFFKGIEKGRRLTGANYSARIQTRNKFGEVKDIDYGSSATQLSMLGVPALHGMGYTGAGILIGVFDSGFTNANMQGYLSHLFANNQIADTWDFVARNANVYNDHSHGLAVLSVMASKLEGNLVGPAFDASYALYRTENDFNETPYEEVTWLLAAERADSLGVDIINSSLGYYDFDDAAHNYKYEDMNGKTTIISRAARIASRCGMLVVSSAGNEGYNAWKYITAPADVDSVLTVGAVTNTGVRASFSSFGPNAEGVIKPDVVALGSSVRMGLPNNTLTYGQGTSYSSPLIASFAALLWQLYPNYTAQQIADLLRDMGNRADSPNNEIGYGIPYFDQALAINRPTNLAASLNGNVVNLNWEFLQSNVASTYEIQRSHNGDTFEKLTTVTNGMQFADTLREDGTYQYRIRAVVGLRNSHFSDVVSIVFTITGREPVQTGSEIWPNPLAGDILNLRFNTPGSLGDIEIFDSSGQVRQRNKVTIGPTGVVELSVSSLPPGLYLLKIFDGNRTQSVRRFVKY